MPDDPASVHRSPPDIPAWRRIQEEMDHRQTQWHRGERLLLASGKVSGVNETSRYDTMFDEALGPDAPLEHTNPDGYTALVIAAKNGLDARVARLLDAGAALHAATHDGWTALHHAVDRLHLDVVIRLIAHGADVTRKVPQGSTPEGRNVLHLLVARASGLHASSTATDAQIAMRLIAAGCDPEQGDAKGHTPLQRLQKSQGRADRPARGALLAVLETHAMIASIAREPDLEPTTARTRPRL